MAARHIDFDQAWAEADKASAPPSITVRGETFDLPRSLPVATVLLAERHLGDEGLPSASYLAEGLAPIVGQDRIDRWLAEGLTSYQLWDLYGSISAMYRLGDDQEGEAVPPATGGSSEMPSTGGVSSKPTGSASTGST